MEVNAKNLNRYLMFKLPAAFLCGVKLRTLEPTKSTVTVKHKWINQNPFKSMYFAVQSMAAELSTGAILIKNIKESNQNFSTLIVGHNGVFTKKATGLITFSCNSENIIKDAILKAIETGEGQVLTLASIGTDEEGYQVSYYEFNWSIKVKKK